MSKSMADRARDLCADDGEVQRTDLDLAMAHIRLDDAETIDVVIEGLSSTRDDVQRACAETLGKYKEPRGLRPLADGLPSRVGSYVGERFVDAIKAYGKEARPVLDDLVQVIRGIDAIDVWEHRAFVDALLVVARGADHAGANQLLRELVDKTQREHGDDAFYGYQDFLEGARKVLDGVPEPSWPPDFGEHAAVVEEARKIQLQMNRLWVLRWKPHSANPGYDTRGPELAKTDDVLGGSIDELRRRERDLLMPLWAKDIDVPDEPPGVLGEMFREIKDTGSTIGWIKHRVETELYDVNQPDPTGFTLLHFAVGRGDASLIEALLAAGANRDAEDNGGWTPLKLAEQVGDAELIAALDG
jgi:hypothetical protein